MPLEAAVSPVSERVDELNRIYAHHSAASVLEHALRDPLVGRTALLSSFGAESVVLLHMVSVIDRTTPVLFLDTEMLFPETLEYQRDVATALRLTDVRVFGPDRDLTFVNDPNSRLHVTNPDACCAMRKSEPLKRALAPFEAWVTGRKRVQGGKRTALRFFEADGENRMKINPLAHFSHADIEDYLQNNRLPRHPLVSKGYASIGCAPCTTKVAPGEDARAGRWRGLDKSECGIHLVNGQTVRRFSEART
ncbi:phosphoadenylyl-sulfate reductase [Boseongicola aestuarii]|uniref:Adenosine 5'-phosphosulfate reductase n=1 Tax=Boseongicola aestuarii TaxID=1470561 RepID=A0A238J1A9_9RHOB|nr:phosphoadenylyl-sulfate reductase [Boseongicola aestuarii]SMX24397.1 Phosphoadenosine phosphosulfate reductase [Boseongicola aestuarii]